MSSIISLINQALYPVTIVHRKPTSPLFETSSSLKAPSAAASSVKKQSLKWGCLVRVRTSWRSNQPPRTCCGQASSSDVPSEKSEGPSQVASTSRQFLDRPPTWSVPNLDRCQKILGGLAWLGLVFGVSLFLPLCEKPYPFNAVLIMQMV